MAASQQLTTERLHMRPFRMDDLDQLHEIWTDPKVRKYLWDDEVISKGQALEVVKTSIACFRKNGFGLFAVFPKDDEERVIGFCGYHFFHRPRQLQLLYGFRPGFWGRGYATEAVRAMIKRGFEKHKFEHIIASSDFPNKASLRVMEKAGMKFLRRAEVGGIDTVYYIITRDDYEAQIADEEE
ncbi:MAG TPA: GNAT family N-acetyltransferase [Acidobacteriota bacterium]|nr:GNAT family N-acetyltransferase [Acidobacteriota bacterium]